MQFISQFKCIEKLHLGIWMHYKRVFQTIFLSLIYFQNTFEVLLVEILREGIETIY